MSKNNVDTLCVIHQSTDFDVMISLPAFQHAHQIFVLTSHKLFPHEISSLTTQFDTIGKVLSGTACFGDFLDDKSLAVCDTQASEALLLQRGSADYIAQYQANMSELKNQALLDAVECDWQFDRIIVSEGVGISSSIWLAARLDTNLVPVDSSPSRLSMIRRVAQKVRGWIPKLFFKHELLRIDNDPPVFFCSSTSRLNLRSDIKSERLTGSIEKLQNHLSETQGSVLATTIHNYQADGLQQRLSAPFEIYVDGLHPANMPRSYLDGYPDACYVVRDMFDDQWFRQFGKRTKLASDFLESSEMALPRGHGLVNKVYLMLNHAGDWMALINRSDTDVLLLAFVELARKYPSLQFIVRPHPGTAHAEHEGVGAIDRMKKLVAVVRLSNLEVSDGTLEQDLAAADLIVSEYSNVLVEGWRMGVPGLVVNLTRRRNFMQDFSDLGFSTVSSESDLQTWLAKMLADPESLIQTQTRAVASYNQRLALYKESV